MEGCSPHTWSIASPKSRKKIRKYIRLMRLDQIPGSHKIKGGLFMYCQPISFSLLGVSVNGHFSLRKTSCINSTHFPNQWHHFWPSKSPLLYSLLFLSPSPYPNIEYNNWLWVISHCVKFRWPRNYQLINWWHGIFKAAHPPHHQGSDLKLSFYLLSF